MADKVSYIFREAVDSAKKDADTAEGLLGKDPERALEHYKRASRHMSVAANIMLAGDEKYPETAICCLQAARLAIKGYGPVEGAKRAQVYYKWAKEYLEPYKVPMSMLFEVDAMIKKTDVQP